MKFSDLLNQIIEWKGIKNPSELSKMLGYKSPEKILRLFRDEKNHPSFEMIQVITNAFPEINPNWLITGNPPMLLSGNHSNVLIPIPKDVTIAPLITQYAHAKYLSAFGDPEYMDAQPIYYARRKHSGGHYVAFEIRGDSMTSDNPERSILDGDIVLGRELRRDLWKSKLHIPRVFVVVHQTEGIVCKDVIRHDVENCIITCHSWNDSPEYEDFEVNLNEVRQLFYVKEINREIKL